MLARDIAKLTARSHRWCAAWLALAPASAWALVTGETADRVADVLAIVIIVLVPIAGIYLFWKIHVLPEKIAEKRQHPQKEAIHVLCLLSLVFGGLLWPIAWLWAYTKPTLHKLAYGTDKHEDALNEPREQRETTAATAASTESLEARLIELCNDVERLSDSGASADDVALLKHDIARLEKKLPPTARRGAH